MGLPISREQAHRVAKWMKTNFGEEIRKATANTSFSLDIVCAIACQETAFFWANRIPGLSISEILARCVLDASGDAPGHPRGAFPKNTEAFRSRYGDAFTDMLIAEANKTRQLRGMGPKNWVYKGYGIFQYDLQAVKEDEQFFREKKWYVFSECLDRLMKELNEKFEIFKEVKEAIRAYNGSGPAAREYANNVMEFARYCAEVDSQALDSLSLTTSGVSDELRMSIEAIQDLRFFPEALRTEYYDSVVAPLIESLASSVTGKRDPKSIAEWLRIQALTFGFAAEGITEVTYELSRSVPELVKQAKALLPLEQQVRIEWLLGEFEGQERFAPDFIDEVAELTSARMAALADDNQPRAVTGILGEFVETETFTSSRGFPAAHGTFTLFAPDGSQSATFTANSGGGSSSYRTTNGPLPPGVYRVSNHRPNRTKSGMVLNGIGYSFDLDPTDGTQVFGRSLFRIHPDGNPRGTNGCIGVREGAEQLRQCENLLESLLKNNGFKISIRYL